MRGDIFDLDSELHAPMSLQKGNEMSHKSNTLLQVFAPLARLLGLYSIKEELEELAFGYSMPEEYTPLRLHLEQIAKEQSPVVQQVCSQIFGLESMSTSLAVPRFLSLGYFTLGFPEYNKKCAAVEYGTHAPSMFMIRTLRCISSCFITTED